MCLEGIGIKDKISWNGWSWIHSGPSVSKGKKSRYTEISVSVRKIGSLVRYSFYPHMTMNVSLFSVVGIVAVDILQINKWISSTCASHYCTLEMTFLCDKCELCEFPLTCLLLPGVTQPIIRYFPCCYYLSLQNLLLCERDVRTWFNGSFSKIFVFMFYFNQISRLN